MEEELVGPGVLLHGPPRVPVSIKECVAEELVVPGVLLHGPPRVPVSK